jgi:type VI secretion system Hcp family effector
MLTAVLMAGIALGVLSLDEAHAQGYLKFTGVQGEVTVEGYEGWSDFISVVQRIAPTETTRGVATRVGDIPEFQQIALVKPLDKASLKIAERALRRIPTETVEIEWVVNFGGDLKPYYRYELEDVTVVEYSSKGLGEPYSNQGWDGQIKEQIVLDFDEITVTYWEYDEFGNPLGAVEYSWKRR